MALARASASDIFPMDFLSSLMGQASASSLPMTRALHMDVNETDNSFEIKADVPGVTKDEVNVTVEGDTVRLSVEKMTSTDKDELAAGGTVIHRSERSACFASRSLRFPPSADLASMKARLDHGVLHVSVPKKEVEEGGKKRVAVE